MKRILCGLLLVAGLLVTLTVSYNSANAQSGNPWSLFYYNNPNWSGNPVFTSSAGGLNFNWNGGSPAPRAPSC